MKDSSLIFSSLQEVAKVFNAKWALALGARATVNFIKSPNPFEDVVEFVIEDDFMISSNLIKSFNDLSALCGATWYIIFSDNKFRVTFR